MSELPTQLLLFELPPEKPPEERYTGTRWYYLLKDRDQKMLHYISRDGDPVWTEHDTRTCEPMLFAGAVCAKQAMKRHGATNKKRWYFNPANRLK